MNTFTLTREFDAPAAILFHAWTDLDALRRWWGPKGFTMESCTLDVRPGGRFHYCMRGPDGSAMWGKLEYREVRRPDLLVFVSSFSDKDANAVRHPMAPGWPLEIHSTVTFTERDGKTTLQLSADVPGATPDELAMFVGNFDSLRGGWGGSLAQLEAYLGETAREIVIRRRIEAPRELVFRAWTDPAHLERWWGPNGFSTTTSEFEHRPGGRWRYVMHGPDGTDYPNLQSYEEIAPPERIVYSHGTGNPGEAPLFHVTVTFSDDAGGTLVTLRSLFPTAEARDHVVRRVKAIEGGEQTLGRLAAYLERP
jgi:uncharacterized protein YndB with AHSA1/START domain